MRTNYILIDYENVQPSVMSALCDECFKVIVFIGASQAKVTFEVASALQRMGNRAEYVKITGNGSNALDFHIAYYIGQLASKEAGAYFHIISKDAGFDPLILHLKTKKILASRSKDITDIPIVKASNSKTPSDRLNAVIDDLRRRGAARPRTLKTLTSTIHSFFQKQLSEQELLSLVAALQEQGIAMANGTKLSYTLPEPPSRSSCVR